MRGPLEFARLAIAAFQHVLLLCRLLPLRAHVEQVHEEVVGQCLRPLGKHAVLRVREVRTQCAHAADEHRHLRCGEAEQLRLVEQQRCGVFFSPLRT